MSAPDPSTETRDQRRLAEHWADNAVAQLRTIEDPAAWIVARRNDLARVDQFAPAHFQKIKAAIAERWSQLERP